MTTPQIMPWLLQRGEEHKLGGACSPDNCLLPIERFLADANPSVVGNIVLVQPWTIIATANVEQAVVLSQLAYWIGGKRGTHSISADPGRGLMGVNTARSSPQIADATGQTSDGVDHVLDCLKAAGLIDWKSTYFACLKVRHIWLTSAALQAASQPCEGRVVAFRVWLADYLASMPDKWQVSTATIAYMASQLYYWYSRRNGDGAQRPLAKKPKPDAGLTEPWFYKRNTDLAAELRLSCTKVDRAMAALKRIGLVHVSYCMRGDKRTGRVMLISSAWKEAVASVSAKEEKK